MDVDDVDDQFGGFLDRPNTRDFWRMSSAILKMDGRISESVDQELAFSGAIAEIADLDSVVYMANQRALRLGDLSPEVTTQMAAMWIDGFICGTQF